MRTMRISVLSGMLLLSIGAVRAQHSSEVVFDSTLNHPAARTDDLHHNTRAWGLNILMSTNGFGMGAFYRKEYTSDLAGFIDLSISEAKDDQEVEYFDPYTGQNYVPGKINRFLMFPLMFGVEQRLFRNQIMDNFRPFLEGAIGPTMIYVFPYNDDYFSALGHGHPQYTGAAYIGMGSYFGGQESNLLGINIRYYYIPYPKGIDSFLAGTQVTRKTQFGGFYITIHFGSSW